MMNSHAQQMPAGRAGRTFSTMISALRINAGPSAYQLQETMLQIRKFLFTDVVFCVKLQIF